jgi:hypothetical protein
MENDTPSARPQRGRLRLSRSSLAVVLLTAVVTAFSTAGSLKRYAEFESGWSWDLAYYNQWFWALTKGNGLLTVRPIAFYGTEGPSVWKMNYLSPVRFLIAPVYWLFPGPRTLLVIQNVVFWWIIPASYTLVRSESRSDRLALAAAFLIPLTPILWPLAWNDFRELQLAMSFIIWAIQGVRARSVRLAAVGIGGMLACRQELALVAITFAAIPGREPEDIATSYRWAQSLILVGLGWFVFGFFGYLRLGVSQFAAEQYLGQFGGPKPTLVEMLGTVPVFVIVGCGAWAFLACAAPRIGVIAVPWVWTVCQGKWALRLLAEESWHHVRYAAPATAVLLAAGLIGYARIGRHLRERMNGRAAYLLWLSAAGVSLVCLFQVIGLMKSAPRPFGPTDLAAAKRWVAMVQPNDGVLADYPVTAPLSSRSIIYSYVLEPNRPRDYPRLGAEFRWIFFETSRYRRQLFEPQGFEVVHAGPSLMILRRTP